MDRQGFDRPLTDAPDISLAQRKAEFLDATRRLDPLAPLRKHPFVTVGTAAMLGLTVGSPHLAAKVKKAKSSIPLRVLKAVGLRAVQYFVQARAAKMHSAAVARATPESAEASA